MIQFLHTMAINAAVLLTWPMLISTLHASSLDLSGKWQVRLDPSDVGESQKWFDEVVGQSNGMIAAYRISASEDGKSWKTIHEAVDPSGKILFKSPVVAKAIRFEALSSSNGTSNCVLAEIAPVLDAGVTEVDELGLVEGFNAPAK